MNCGNLWNNLSNLPMMNYNNNNLIGEGEGLDIHYLIDMHGRNGFDAIPRIRCLIDDDKGIVFNKSTGQGTPIEHALTRGHKDVANAIVNSANGLNIIRDIVGSKRITAQKVKVIKLVLSKKIPIPVDTVIQFIKRLSKGNRTSTNRMEVIKNLQKRVNQRAFRVALKNAKGIGSLPPELKKLIAERL